MALRNQHALLGPFVSLLLSLGLGSPSLAADYIDEIVVLVGGEALTASRIAFMKAYLNHVDGEGMGRPLIPEDYGTLEGVQGLLEEDAIIDSMAARLPLLQPKLDDVRYQRVLFRGSFEGDAAYEDFVETWGFSDDVQHDFFTRRLRIEAFVDLKIGDFEGLSDRELEAYFQTNRARYGEGDLATLRAAVTEDYSRALRRERFREWMEGYRRNHRDMIRSPTASAQPRQP